MNPENGEIKFSNPTISTPSRSSDLTISSTLKVPPIPELPRYERSRPFVIGMYEGKTPGECEAMVGTNPFNRESPGTGRRNTLD